VSFPVDESFAESVRGCAVRIAQEGAAALGDLFDLTAPRALRFASTLTRNGHDAEDAVQAALVRVALHPKALAKADHAWAYLLRIVRNEALKINQKQRERPLELKFDEADDPIPLDLADTQRFVREAVALLPPSQSEVIVLKIWEGLTFAEIAAVLDESPNTAASRYRYALQKLSQSLQPLLEPRD
jgi:RNA polymerase sigma-70 factor (ECF subfamily)